MFLDIFSRRASFHLLEHLAEIIGALKAELFGDLIDLVVALPQHLLGGCDLGVIHVGHEAKV